MDTNVCSVPRPLAVPFKWFIGRVTGLAWTGSCIGQGGLLREGCGGKVIPLPSAERCLQKREEKGPLGGVERVKNLQLTGWWIQATVIFLFVEDQSQKMLISLWIFHAVHFSVYHPHSWKCLFAKPKTCWGSYLIDYRRRPRYIHCSFIYKSHTCQ